MDSSPVLLESMSGVPEDILIGDIMSIFILKKKNIPDDLIKIKSLQQSLSADFVTRPLHFTTKNTVIV